MVKRKSQKGYWGGENTHNGALNFYPIFIPLFEGKVSGVSVQDRLLHLPFLTPETKLAEQKGFKKLSLSASSYKWIFITLVQYEFS